MKRPLFLALLLIGSLWLPVACTANSLIYPGSNMQLPDTPYGHSTQAITISAEDGTKLRGWFFNRGSDTPLVAMYGGNAMNVGAFADIAAADTSRSYLLMNYRGYGSSEGEPSEKVIVADARHCIAYTRRLMAGKETPLYLVGFSLGSSVATQVAAAEQAEKLILICPFDSITTVACGIVPVLPHLLPLDSWSSKDYAPQVICPVTILRGKYDTIVPPSSTDELIHTFPAEPNIISYPTGHNDIFSAPHFTIDLLRALDEKRPQTILLPTAHGSGEQCY